MLSSYWEWLGEGNNIAELPKIKKVKNHQSKYYKFEEYSISIEISFNVNYWTYLCQDNWLIQCILCLFHLEVLPSRHLAMLVGQHFSRTQLYKTHYDGTYQANVGITKWKNKDKNFNLNHMSMSLPVALSTFSLIGNIARLFDLLRSAHWFR